jgi:hypothetical protein
VVIHAPQLIHWEQQYIDVLGVLGAEVRYLRTRTKVAAHFPKYVVAWLPSFACVRRE